MSFPNGMVIAFAALLTIPVTYVQCSVTAMQPVYQSETVNNDVM